MRHERKAEEEEEEEEEEEVVEEEEEEEEREERARRPRVRREKPNRTVGREARLETRTRDQDARPREDRLRAVSSAPFVRFHIVSVLSFAYGIYIDRATLDSRQTLGDSTLASPRLRWLR